MDSDIEKAGFLKVYHGMLDSAAARYLELGARGLLIEWLRRWERETWRKGEPQGIPFAWFSCPVPCERKAFNRLRQELISKGFMTPCGEAGTRGASLSGMYQMSEAWREYEPTSEEAARVAAQLRSKEERRTKRAEYCRNRPRPRRSSWLEGVYEIRRKQAAKKATDDIPETTPGVTPREAADDIPETTLGAGVECVPGQGSNPDPGAGIESRPLEGRRSAHGANLTPGAGVEKRPVEDRPPRGRKAVHAAGVDDRPPKYTRSTTNHLLPPPKAAQQRTARKPHVD